MEMRQIGIVPGNMPYIVCIESVDTVYRFRIIIGIKYVYISKPVFIRICHDIIGRVESTVHVVWIIRIEGIGISVVHRIVSRFRKRKIPVAVSEGFRVFKQDLPVNSRIPFRRDGTVIIMADRESEYSKMSVCQDLAVYYPGSGFKRHPHAGKHDRNRKACVIKPLLAARLFIRNIDP